MSFELPEIKIVLRASLVLTLITMVGYYFPDLTISGFIVYVCTVIATKHLTKFNWFGTVIAFILIAGSQNTGGHIPTCVFGRCLVGSLIAFLLVQQDKYDARNK